MADNAADVAEDYRQALEDLTMNSRIEIATLTNIARENANHGLAIAEVLQNHIKKVSPSRTLPALYVLDSVVKNVPTPYALYFGPKLYSIFMGAYTKVDNATRRKMDEMLKTWKEPVPGSISTKPVFPMELVRPIENALMAARSAALAAQQSSFQGQQQLLRGRAPAPSRDTPTPPTARPYQPPPHGQPPFPPSNGQYPDAALAQQPYPMRPVNGPNAIPHRATPQPAPSAGALPPYQQPAGRDVYGTPQPGLSIDKLKDDIQQLIIAEKAEFAQDPLDTSKQTRLKALLDLQTIIQSQETPQDQLMIIRDRVAELAVNMRSQSQPRPTATGGPAVSAAAAAAAAPHLAHAGIPYTTPTPPVVSQQPTPVPPAALAAVAAALARPPSSAAVPPPAAPPPAAGGGGVSIDALFGQGALATLIAGAARKSVTPQQVPTPQPPPAVLPPATAALRSPPPQRPAEPPQPAAAPSANPSALLAMLRQSGLIGGSAGPAPAVPAVPALPGMSGFPLPPDTSLQLKPASLKIFRPHLIAQLHEDLGPPCTQCGRRFKTDEEGRRKKTAHMDWHFRVHQRITEAEKRGQHRSWYVDELDWIRSREAIDTDYVAPQDLSSSSTPDFLDDAAIAKRPAGGGKSAASSRAQQQQYLPVPEDSSRVNNTCPICQERFEMKWLDEAQEWVWTDAVRVGERVYHASCHREAAGSMAYNQRPTPERVLGKRKAEDDVGGFRGKMKMEEY
ncbi:mRNA 3' end processing factor [Madurella fahalii]|uniref:mRNA 3' end processing factor n=1 Tax=Madurella fahalii TaxID=1157608 RepID=A0ABQ0G5F3_9PEZI